MFCNVMETLYSLVFSLWESPMHSVRLRLNVDQEHRKQSVDLCACLNTIFRPYSCGPKIFGKVRFNCMWKITETRIVESVYLQCSYIKCVNGDLVISVWRNMWNWEMSLKYKIECKRKGKNPHSLLFYSLSFYRTLSSACRPWAWDALPICGTSPQMLAGVIAEVVYESRLKVDISRQWKQLHQGKK